MKIMGVKLKQLMAMTQQSASAGGDSNCPFAQMLQQAAAGQTYKAADSSSTTSGSSSTPSSSNSTGSTAQQVKTRLDQAIAEAFIAPLLAQTAVNAEQKYFLHSPAEQAYAQQMYTQLAGQIGTSGKMPLAKSIAKAVLQQMGQSSLWTAKT